MSRRQAVCVRECYWLSRRWVPGDVYNAEPGEQINEEDTSNAKVKQHGRDPEKIPHHFKWADQADMEELLKPPEGEFEPPPRKRVGRPAHA